MSAPSQRRTMLDEHLRRRGLVDPAVLAAMGRVPRERFVPTEQQAEAYADRALAIDCGQTISQPYVVAYMTAQLGVRKPDRVLEIGTGSGYQTAVLADLVDQVYTIERHDALSAAARRVLQELGIHNVTYCVGDGTAGWPAFAPFDRIVVTAAGPEVPPPLREQLAVGGRLIMPIGAPRVQRLVVVERLDRGFRQTASIGCRFVPLHGQWGWPTATPSRNA